MKRKASPKKVEALAALSLHPNIAEGAGAGSGCQFQAERQFQVCYGPYLFLLPPCFFTCFS